MLLNYLLFLFTLLLIGGLALDTGILEWRQQRLQQAADAAAQEAIYETARNNGDWITAAKAQASLNGFTDGVNGATVSVGFAASSDGFIDYRAVQSSVTQSANNIFMGLIHSGKSTVTATATGRVIPTCIWIMNPTSTFAGGATFWLASSKMQGSCGVFINTASGNSMNVDYFASLDVVRTRVVGPSSGNVSTGSVYTPPRFGSAAKNDPLAYLTAPTFSSCTYNRVSISNTSTDLSPGTYCGGITMNNADVVLSPGLYIITGGLSMNNSTLDGRSGVTLYFTSGGGSGYGTISATGSAPSGTNFSSNVLLNAPTTSSGGGIPGIAIFGDRRWIAHGSYGLTFSNTYITGDAIWYVLNTGVSFWDCVFTNSAYSGLVVDCLYQYGSFDGAGAWITTDYTALGGVSPYHYDDGVLVQ
jgi:Flp pilus assembly protein TadG